MKLTIMTMDAINYILKNIETEEVVNHYIKGDDPKTWITKAIGKPAFWETDLEAELPTLKLSTSDAGKAEAENCKLLYAALADINNYVTFDQRFWSGLSHTFYYNYIRKIITNKSSKNNVINSKTIKEHFFFPTVRSKIKPGTIPRLYTFGKTYIRKNSENPYKLIDLISGNDWTMHTLRMHTINAFNNPLVVETFIKCEEEFENKHGKKYTREMIFQLTQYTNTFFKNNELPDELMTDVLKNKLMKKAEKLLEKSEEKHMINYSEVLMKVLNENGGYISFENFIDTINKINKYSNEIKDGIINFVTDELSKTNSKFIKEMYSEDNKYLVANTNLVSIEVKENIEKFKNKVINSLSEDGKNLFNLVLTLEKQNFTKELLNSYKIMYIRIHDNTFDFDKMIESGIIELEKHKIILENNDGSYHINF